MNEFPEITPLSSTTETGETPDDKRIRVIVEQAMMSGYRMAKAEAQTQAVVASDAEQEASNLEVQPSWSSLASNNTLYNERLSFTKLLTKRNFVMLFGCVVSIGIINVAWYVIPQLSLKLFGTNIQAIVNTAALWLDVFVVLLLVLFVVLKYVVWSGTRLLKEGEYLVYIRLRLIPFPGRSRKRLRIRDIQVLDTDQSPLEVT